MSRRRASLRLLAAVAVALVVLGWAPAGAQGADAPAVVVDPAVVEPGDSVLLTIAGFRARNVTVTVCGNGAVRGSLDCHQPGGEGMGLRDEVTRRDFVVSAPPVPCPCVVRVASRTQDEVALAPLELVGHPSAPVVHSASSRLLEVSVSARRAPRGVGGHLRASLGGPTRYEVEVTVRNRSGLPLDGVEVSAVASRGGHQLVAADLPDIGTIEPGASWVGAAETVVPAPLVGALTWEARASGAGPSTTDRATSRPVPHLLLVLLAVLVADLVAIVLRWRRRRTGRRGAHLAGRAEPRLLGAR